MQRYEHILQKIKLTFLIFHRQSSMVITDTSKSEKKLDKISTDLTELGEQIGVAIHAQHEDIFNKMHRI